MYIREEIYLKLHQLYRYKDLEIWEIQMLILF